MRDYIVSSNHVVLPVGWHHSKQHRQDSPPLVRAICIAIYDADIGTRNPIFLGTIYPTSKGYENLYDLTLRKGPLLSKKPLVTKGVASKKSISKYEQIIV